MVAGCPAGALSGADLGTERAPKSHKSFVRDPSWARQERQSSLMKCPTVLCVDDDASIRELYEALLARNGYEVIAASNGRHALHVLQGKEKEIDAVILDYEMPGMNGLELAAWLKQLRPKLPVIMISGSHPVLEEMAPFVDAAMGKGVPLQNILDRLQVLLAS